MQNSSNSRRVFLKKLSIALGSVILFSGLDLKKSNANVKQIKKSGFQEDFQYKVLSKSEADNIIKNNNSPAGIRLKPEPAPIDNILINN